MAASKLSSKKKKKTLWQRHRVAIIAGAVVFVAAAVLLGKFIAGSKPSTHKPPNIMAVALPKPPPPPTPPPPTPPPEPPKPDDKVIPKEVEKIEKPPEKPPEAPPALGSAIKGNGNDGFGLSGSGDGVIGGLGSGSGGGDQRRWYAGQVQSSVVQALRNNKQTRNASFGDKVRIWVDATGRVTKVEIESTSGNAAVDTAIKNEILTGLRLEQAPPGGKPMFVEMRLNARRPN